MGQEINLLSSIPRTKRNIEAREDAKDPEVVRISKQYGEMYFDGPRDYGYGPNRFRRLAEDGEDIVLFGEGEERRDHVWVEDVAELAVLILTHRSSGALNAATGTVVSFREAAEQVVSHFDNPVAIKGSPRSGPMPHNGYRAFDPAATMAAFPDFSYTQPTEGFAMVHQDIFGA